jgi:hypothetical protein
MRQALALKVYVDEKQADICIESPDFGGGEQIVAVSPDQVDQLIEWLKEKKAEALELRAGK